MRVLAECYPDEALLRALGVPRKQLRHERCKGEVVKKVAKRDDTVGVVDEDPASAQPRDLGNYEVISEEEGLRLLVRRGNKAQRIIVICPRLEDWLIQRAKAAGVRLQDYALPDDPNRLHALGRYDQKNGFPSLLAELINRDEAMRLLRQWVLSGRQ